MSEAVGWLVIAGTVIAYMRSQSGIPKGESLKGPDPELAVDPSRWRHTGEQPVYYKDGNRAAVVDEHVKALLMYSGVTF